MALPFDEAGPQTGAFGRFNPIHLMFRDGADALAGTSVRDFYGGVDRYFRGTDDMIIMPLQSGTQWDSLGHVVYEDKIYNGYGAEWVSSKGALKNSVKNGADGMVGRGVLLDLPRALGVDWLEPGHAISGEDLQAAADRRRSRGRGGRLRVRPHRGDDLGPSPRRLGRLCRRQCAGSRSRQRRLGGRARHRRHRRRHLGPRGSSQRDPRRLPAAPHRLHRPHGPVARRDLRPRPLADDCAADGVYEFFFCGPPLPFTRAVGSP